MWRYSSGKIYFYLGAIAILLIFLNFLGWLNPVKSLFRSVFLPISTSVNSWRQRWVNDYDFFKNRDLVFQNLNKCETQIQNEAVMKAQNQMLLGENNELKKELAFKKKQNVAQIAAQVVGNNLDSMESSVIIDQGQNSGIKVGQPVIIGEGIIVGEIAKAEKDTAVVRLISDNQSKIAATILNDDRSMGVVEGGYGISIRMTFIPRNEVVKVGDQITTSGLEGSVPKGLLIGTVAAVENEAYQPFQEAVLTPAADLSKISIVSVLLTN